MKYKGKDQVMPTVQNWEEEGRQKLCFSEGTEKAKDTPEGGRTCPYAGDLAR